MDNQRGQGEKNEVLTQKQTVQWNRKDQKKSHGIKILIHELEQAKYELSNATITAQKSGIISEINAKIGDIVDKNTKIATITPDECIILANFKKLPSKNFYFFQSLTVLMSLSKAYVNI